MSGHCPIIFGPLSKKLFIPFFYALNQITTNIFVLYYPYKNSQLIEFYSMSIGTMLNLIIPHIKYFSPKENKLIAKIKNEKEKCCSKKCFLQYFILIILNSTSIFLASISLIIKQNSVENIIDTKVSLVGVLLYMKV